MAEAATTDALVALFGQTGRGKINHLKAGDEAILVTKADADAKSLCIWYLKDGGTADSAADDTIVLLGYVNTDTSTEVKLTSADFTVESA